MIDLRIKAEFQFASDPFVVKVCMEGRPADASEYGTNSHAIAVERQQGVYDCHSNEGDFTLYANANTELDGDVLICYPHKGQAHRFFRRSSRHNTILFTERCDQLCVMCSQPPRNVDTAWLFPLFEKALRLVDHGSRIGVSGGEPTLYKNKLFEMISNVNVDRPDISYQILTNAQHFDVQDRKKLNDLNEVVDIIWGVPLYSHKGEQHDEIVGKAKAFDKLMENLFVLGSANATIELRTVITALNFLELPELAKFIGKQIPFISRWAIMGMEPIGYAKANYKRIFVDHSAFPIPLVNAIRISNLKNIDCQLYNVPRCTVPPEYREYCADSISDWKNKFLPLCDRCVEQEQCCGFFEWYDEKWSWAGVSPVLAA
jgi:His-Xaa-Ser system radical SAM maturase HxsC